MFLLFIPWEKTTVIIILINIKEVQGPNSVSLLTLADELMKIGTIRIILNIFLTQVNSRIGAQEYSKHSL